MTLFKQNNELALINKLSSVERKPDKWSAVQLKSHLLNMSQTRKIRTKRGLELFTHLADQKSITPYFCRDNDVYFIYQNTKDPHLTEIKNTLHALLPQLQSRKMDLDALLTHYPLGENYMQIYNAVHDKVQILIEKNKHHVGQTPEEVDKSGEFIWSEEIFTQALLSRSERTSKLFMIAEDDALLRDMALHVINQEFNVKTAYDGSSALENYNRYAPDIVFLDINMPGKNGIELLEEFIHHDPDSCIIMFTGSKTMDVVTKAKQIGAKGFITKPFTPETLLKYARKFSQ